MYGTNRHSTLSLLRPTPLRNYRRTVLNIGSRQIHCNVSDSGIWTYSSSWVMQYTLARRIPTHPTFPHSLNTFQVSKYGNWTVCSWVGESGGKNNACNANDKPASTLPPASWSRKTWFTRGRVRQLKYAHNSVTVQNRTHIYMNFFDHKDLGNHLLQYYPQVLKHPV